MSKYRLLVTLMLCAAAATAQVKQVTAQLVSQTDKAITYRITNESRQAMAAYTLGIDIVYADGHTAHSEQSEDFGPTREGIAAGVAREATLGYGTSPAHGRIVQVTLTPLVAIYHDGSAEAQDAAVFHRIADHRVMVAKALEEITSAIQQALSDRTDEHPSIKAATLIEADIKTSDAETAGPKGTKRMVAGKTPIQPDESFLTDAVKRLQQLRTSPDEREELTKYLASKQEKLHEYAAVPVRLD
jgi:hypothetical protein